MTVQLLATVITQYLYKIWCTIELVIFIKILIVLNEKFVITNTLL